MKGNYIMENIECTACIERLQDEFDEIFDYVTFYENFFYHQKRYVIDEIRDEVELLLGEYAFYIVDSSDEEKNQDIIAQINNLLNSKLEEKRNLLDTLERKPFPEWSDDLEILSGEYGFAEYLDRSNTSMNFAEYQQYLSELKPEKLKEEIDEIPEGEEYYSQFTVDDYSKLLEYIQILFHNNYIDDIEHDVKSLMESITIYGMMNAESQTNIFRQGFVLLMTAFDATISDITQVILEENFFEFLARTDCKAKNKNYKLSEIVSLNNFESFKEKVIDEIMKENYVAGLLKLLYQYHKSYFIVDGQDKYRELCEIVARRNIHVHKRGIVDTKYFSDSQGNIYNFQENDYAFITGNYFEQVYELLLRIINNFK